MKAVPLFALAFLAGIAAPVHSQTVACRAPERPVIPDGSVATESQMVEAQQAVKAYLAKGDGYLACLKKADESLGEDAPAEAAPKLLAEHNEMVDEMYLTGDEFNVAIRKFKNR